MKAYLLLFFILAAKFCYPQTTTVNSRPAFTLKLFVNDTVDYEASMGATSFIPQKGVLQIFPGEKLFVEAELSNDSLINLRVVPEIVNKEKTLTIAFTQQHENKRHEQMTLTIINPFTKDLAYSAVINLMKLKRWAGTSVLPVLSQKTAYESWPDIITTIVLSNFHLK